MTVNPRSLAKLSRACSKASRKAAVRWLVATDGKADVVAVVLVQAFLEKPPHGIIVKLVLPVTVGTVTLVTGTHIIQHGLLVADDGGKTDGMPLQQFENFPPELRAGRPSHENRARSFSPLAAWMARL